MHNRRRMSWLKPMIALLSLTCVCLFASTALLDSTEAYVGYDDVLRLMVRRDDDVMQEVMTGRKKEQELAGRRGGDGGFARRVIIHSKFRSGATFTGELLRRHENIFYLFEPLHLLQDMGVDINKENAVELLRHALSCNLTALPQHEAAWWRGMLCMAGERLASCPQVDHRAASLLCSTNRVVATKVTRVPYLSDLAELMAEGTLVLHVVRDPRSVLRSWQEYGQFDSSGSEEWTLLVAREYCATVSADMQFARSSSREAGARSLAPYYRLLRYEDMIHDPENYIESVFRAIGIEPDSEVTRWIEDVYKKEYGNTSVGGGREEVAVGPTSGRIQEKWRTELSYSTVRIIQDSCQDMMQQLDYRPVDSAEQMHNAAAPFVDFNNDYPRPPP